MRVTASKLRENVYQILDEALQTGIPVEVIRKGKILKVRLGYNANSSSLASAVSQRWPLNLVGAAWAARSTRLVGCARAVTGA